MPWPENRYILSGYTNRKTNAPTHISQILHKGTHQHPVQASEFAWTLKQIHRLQNAIKNKQKVYVNLKTNATIIIIEISMTQAS